MRKEKVMDALTLWSGAKVELPQTSERHRAASYSKENYALQKTRDMESVRGQRIITHCVTTVTLDDHKDRFNYIKTSLKT